MRIIAGEARGKRLACPADRSVRPALDRMRESLFAIIEGSYEGGRVLDLFAGVGSLGLEAVSRGARGAVFVDHGAQSLALLKRNVEHLGFGARCEIIAGNALEEPRLLAAECGTYAVVFMDPPFAMFATTEDADKVLRRGLALVRSGAIEPRGWLCLRHPSRWRGELLLEPELRKKYGESSLLFYRPEPPVG